MPPIQKTPNRVGHPAVEKPNSAWRLLPPDEGLARIASSDGTVGLRSADGFSMPECMAAAGRAAERAGEEVVVVASWTGETELLMPLRIEHGLGVRRIVPLSAPLGQYAPAPPAPITTDSFRNLLGELRSQKGGDLLLLRRVRHDNPLLAPLSEIGATPGQQSTAPYIDLEAFADFEAYQDSFSGKTRRNRRRELRRLEELGEIAFTVRPGRDARPHLLQAVEWKRQWLREQGISSPVLDGANWERALLECAHSPHAVVSVLSVGSAPAAIELGFVNDGAYVAYLGAFDPSYGRLSIGQEQMSRTIAWCFEQGFARYDFLPPDDDYKRHWARGETAVPVADFAVPLSPVGQVASMVHQRLRPLARQAVLAAPAGLRRLLVRGPKGSDRAVAGIWTSIVLFLALLDPAFAG